jgi:hypothetical protein
MKNIKKIVISVLMLITLLAPVVTFADIIVAPPDRLPPEDGDTILPPTDVIPDNEESNTEPAPAIAPDPANDSPGLVQCGRKTIEVTKNGITSVIADPNDACNFNELMHLINNIISFILFGLAIPIAGIMFAYAGFTLLTSGGSSGAKTKAKEIFFSAAVGLVISFVAYIIVVFVLKTLGYDGSWIFKTF